MLVNLLTDPKSLLLALCLVLLEPSTGGEFAVRRSSPNAMAIAKGQSLELNITLSGTDETMPMLVFLDWNFRAHLSNSVKRLVSVTWDRGYVVSQEFHDVRASILDSASLLLLDTTFKDSGTYWCNVFSLPSQRYPVLHFNVTVQGRPTAEIQCPEKVSVSQGKNFSCWCNARSAHLTPKASWTWQKKGAPPLLEGERRNISSEELLLTNIKKDMAGTYVCKAELYSMMDEKRLILSVHYAPTIHTFRGKVLKDDSMKMTCLAYGLPRPTYLIKISNGMSFKADVDGVVVINYYKSIINASYVCIARNSVGHDKWRLNGILTISKDETVEKRQSFLGDHVWHIIGASAIAGIIFGFLLMKACQSVFCRKLSRRHANGENHDSPVYVDPSTLSMSQGRKKDPLNYIDVHVIPSTPPGEVNEDMPVYVDPDTVVPSRDKLRKARDEKKASQEGQAVELPEEENRVYQDPGESMKVHRASINLPLATQVEVEVEEVVEDTRVEEEIQENRDPEPTRQKLSVPKPPRSRANTEPMQGYQDLDSSDEIEENFYHSLRCIPKTEYYVNERVKP